MDSFCKNQKTLSAFFEKVPGKFPTFSLYEKLFEMFVEYIKKISQKQFLSLVWNFLGNCESHTLHQHSLLYLSKISLAFKKSIFPAYGPWFVRVCTDF